MIRTIKPGQFATLLPLLFILFEGNFLGLPAPAHGAPPRTEIFVGKRVDYLVSPTDLGYTVTDIAGYGSSRTIGAVDRIQFADGYKNLLIAANAATISEAQLNSLIELYVAFFNRIPDAEGLNYWIEQFKAGQPLTSIANNFFAIAGQYASLTGYSSTMSNDEFVSLIYKNVLGRSGPTAPSAGEVSSWSTELTAGRASQGSLAIAMLTAAHDYKGDPTWGWVPDLLDNKIAVGSYSAVTNGFDYLSPAEAIAKGMAVAAAVTPTSIDAALLLLAEKMPPPATLTLPVGTNDGSFIVTWSASPNGRVIYTLQEATDREFTTGLQTAYSGINTSVLLTGRPSGTYYYRVKASRCGYVGELWTPAANGIVVTGAQ